MKCSISECKMDSVITVRAGPKEKRNLCRHHHNLFKNREERFVPDFKKASELGRCLKDSLPEN